MLELKIEGRRKRSRPVKHRIDAIKEDMRMSGVIRQDIGDKEGRG